MLVEPGFSLDEQKASFLERSPRFGRVAKHDVQDELQLRWVVTSLGVYFFLLKQASPWDWQYTATMGSSPTHANASDESASDRGTESTRGAEDVLASDQLKSLLQKEVTRFGRQDIQVDRAEQMLLDRIEALVLDLRSLAGPARADCIKELDDTQAKLIALRAANAKIEEDRRSAEHEAAKEWLKLVASADRHAADMADLHQSRRERETKSALHRNLTISRFWVPKIVSVLAVGSGVALSVAGQPVGMLLVGAGLYWLAPGLMKSYFGGGQ